MQCPLCGTRRARRTCPALGRQICSVCCGTKRLSEIRCPSDCVYLTSAREHPPAVVQRQQAQDLAVLLPALHTLSEGQARLFFLASTVIARFEPDGLYRLLDADIAEAAAALAATYETSQRGVIYQHRPGSAAAQRLGSAIASVYADVGRGAGSRFERDAAAALRAMEKGARATQASASDTAYLDVLKRLVVRLADRSTASEEDAPKEEASGLIIPGSA